MGALLLLGLTESQHRRLGDLAVDVRMRPDSHDDAELVDALAGAAAALVGGAGLDRMLRDVQAVHRLAPDVRVGVLLEEGDETAWRDGVRFAPGVPVDMEVLQADDPRLGVRLAELTAAASREHDLADAFAQVGRRERGTGADVVRATLGALLEHAPLGVLVADTDGRVLVWNPAAADLLHLESRQAGTSLTEVFPADGGVSTVVAAALASRSSDPGPVHTMGGPGGTHLDVRASISALSDGRTVVLVLVQDATTRIQALHERDRLSAQVDMIGRVSEALLGAHEPDEALQLVAGLVVPVLADWVEMQLFDERAATQRVVARHHDATFAELTARVERAMPGGMSPRSPSRRIAQGEGPFLLPDITADMLEEFIPDIELRRFLTHLGVASAIAVPLSGRSARLGSLVLLNRTGSPRFGQQDLVLAIEVGRRLGTALETLQQHGRQRALAEALQRSMLTDPPVVPHAEIVVRYRPAANEAQVGGDWYDSYVQDDGSVVVSIGDVVGHDSRAAAAMGQLRGLLRGIGYASGRGPAETLRALDTAIDGLLGGTTASAVVAVVDRPRSGEAGCPVRWSNAGHPPPILVRPGGRPQVLTQGPADLILGVLTETERSEQETVLLTGDTLVLYSDGLIERRGRDVDAGLEDLVDTLDELGGLPVAEMCDRTLNRMVPAEQDDDVALLALRIE